MTRWHSFGENISHPNSSDDYKLYINSVKRGDEIRVLKRPLIDRPLIFEFDEDNRLINAGGEIH